MTGTMLIKEHLAPGEGGYWRARFLTKTYFNSRGIAVLKSAHNLSDVPKRGTVSW